LIHLLGESSDQFQFSLHCVFCAAHITAMILIRVKALGFTRLDYIY
jgi:hypothetical protein